MIETSTRKIRRLLAAAWIVCFWAPFGARSLNLVVNGSFETTSPTGATGYTMPFGSALATNGIPGWTFDASDGDNSFNSFDGVLQSGLLGPSGVIENGANCAFDQGTGWFSQTINLTPGAYQLSFYAMARFPLGPDPLQVTLGDLLFATVAPTNTDTTQLNDWTLFSYNFAVATSGPYTLKFTVTIPFSTRDTTTYIDQVSITSSFVSATNATRSIVTVINPSFEDNPLPGDAYTNPHGNLDPQTGVPGWQFAPSDGDSYSGIVTETGTNEVMGSPKFIPQGWQAAFIQGTGQFSQSITFNQEGTYVIRFRAAERVNGGQGPEPIAVMLDGNIIGTFMPVTNQWTLSATMPDSSLPASGGLDASAGQWTLFSSAPFIVTAGTHAVAFAGMIPYTQSDRTSFIDAVQIVSPAEASAVIPPVSPVCDIVYVGDSITYGATLANPVTQASSTRCTESLGQRHDVALRMANQGLSGTTTVDWLPSANSTSLFALASAAAAALESNQPGQLVFSIMLGANDSAQSGPNGSPVSAAHFQQNLQSIINQFLVEYPNADIFVQHPIFYTTNTQNGALYGPQGLARLESYFPVIDQLISNNAAFHPGRVFAGDTMAFGFFQTNYLADMTAESGVQGTFHLHPNAAGAIALGTFWADAIAAGLNFTTNDPYVEWLESADMTPGTPGTGFSETPTNSSVCNGAVYGNPNGLSAKLEADSLINFNVFADIRSDALLNVILQSSTDLSHWNPVTWSVAPNQNGVATGFIRYELEQPIGALQEMEYYHLKLSY